VILVDFSQVMISNLMVAVHTYNKNAEIDEGMLRHMILNSLRSYRKKFGEEYGELVLCCDGRNYWRKDVYPYYKAGRKKTRTESALDWTNIFETLNKIRDEIEEFFPYIVLTIDRCEADDIIGVLVQNKDPFEKVLILSGDKDFMQLQVNVGVDQYAPVQKKFLRNPDPAKYLKEHILRGDSSDGIPNFLSPDDVFVRDGKKQSPIYAKKLEAWVEAEPKDFCTDEQLRNHNRNTILIDLDYIPEEIKTEIQTTFDNAKPGNRMKLLTYFIEHKLKNLMGVIQDF